MRLKLTRILTIRVNFMERTDSNNIEHYNNTTTKPRLSKKSLVQFKMARDEGHFLKSSHCQIPKF